MYFPYNLYIVCATRYLRAVGTLCHCTAYGVRYGRLNGSEERCPRRGLFIVNRKHMFGGTISWAILLYLLRTPFPIICYPFIQFYCFFILFIPARETEGKLTWFIIVEWCAGIERMGSGFWRHVQCFKIWSGEKNKKKELVQNNEYL